MQMNRVRLPATLLSVSFVPFFFSFCFVFVFNPILPFGLFLFIFTDDPAEQALGSIFLLSLSLDFYFGTRISRALDLHTGQAYGHKRP